MTPESDDLACPKCGSVHLTVYASRSAPWVCALQRLWPGRGKFRVRICTACGERFTTREYLWPRKPDPTSPVNTA